LYVIAAAARAAQLAPGRDGCGGFLLTSGAYHSWHGARGQHRPAWVCALV
jgi:hypothetical protein